jgi:hypothetical protein
LKADGATLSTKTLELNVDAANITGKLTANQIDATNLKVNAANITGTLYIGDLEDDVGLVTEDNVTTITKDAIKTASFSADQITTGILEADNVELDGLFDIYNGNTYCGAIGGTNTLANGAGATMAGPGNGAGYVRASSEGAKVAIGEYEIGVYESDDGGGCFSTHPISEGSDRKLKNNISYELDEEEKLFPLLLPCSYEMNNEPGKRHWGFVAQDLIAAAVEAGIDPDKLALVSIYKDTYAVAYSKLIALNTHMIQKLMNRVAALEGK